MSEIIKWLSTYGTEYNVYTKVLHIRKPIPVSEFVLLKKLLKLYGDKIEDIKVGL